MKNRKRVFISSRINEMRDLRAAAVKAILQAGMEPIYFDNSAGSQQHDPAGSEILQLLEAVKTSDVFVGLYGKTFNTNWTPPGYNKHSMVLEYEEAINSGLPCFLYAASPDTPVDEDMTSFRREIMRKDVGFITTSEALYTDLLQKLEQFQARV